MTVSDAKLIGRLASDPTGDGLRTLYRRYAGELYGFALNSLRDRGLAEEVVQDAFTSVWRHADRFDPELGSFRTWLYGLARNRIVDMRRRAAVRPTLTDAEPREEPGEVDRSLEEAMLRWQVAAALAHLSPAHREVRPARSLPGAQPARDRRGPGPPARNREEPDLLRAAAPAARARRDGGGPVTDCAAYRELLGGYVLGALSPEDVALVERHIESCPRCGREYGELAGLPALLDMAGSADTELEAPPRRARGGGARPFCARAPRHCAPVPETRPRSPGRCGAGRGRRRGGDRARCRPGLSPRHRVKRTSATRD